MELEVRKIHFVQEFLRLESEAVVSSLEKLLRKSKIALAEKPMTIDEFNAEIDRALEDSENDRVIPHNEMKAKVQKWR